MTIHCRGGKGMEDYMARKKHVFINGQELKECGRCHVLKTLDSFRKDGSRPSGLYCYCKECAKTKDHICYMKDPQKKYLVVKEYMIKTGEYFKYKPYNPLYYSSPVSRLKKRANHLRRRMLKANANAYFKITYQTIEFIIEKYDGKCAYCNIDCRNKFHIDHKIPLSRGGDNRVENLALSCPTCNLKKKDKTDIEFLAKLKSKKPYCRGGIDVLIEKQEHVSVEKQE
jgi:hypothetical protein